MGHIYKNITTTDATLLSPVSLDQGGSGPVRYNKICIVNTSASYKYSVDLYITRTKISGKDDAVQESRKYVGQDGNWDPLATTTKTYYIIKTVNIPVGATLILEEEYLLFDSERYDFYIKVNDITGSGVTVDVNINLLEPSRMRGSGSMSPGNSGSSSSSGY